jgi:hypothetical protein
MKDALTILQKSYLIILLFAGFAFANNSFMLGAKTFTLDFKGYSGFMLELGGGAGFSMNNDDELFLGIHSGFGYSGKNYSEQIGASNVRVKASSTALPIKAFVSYGLFGASIGTLLTFWDAKFSGNAPGINLSDLNDKGTEAYFDFGLMFFPLEEISVGFDVITGKGNTGFAIGVAYHFGKNKSQPHYEDDNEEIGCGSDPVYRAYIEESEDEINICVELNSGDAKCLSLSDRFEFKNASLDAIEDFETKSSFIEWWAPPVKIYFSEFFPDGVCD